MQHLTYILENIKDNYPMVLVFAVFIIAVWSFAYYAMHAPEKCYCPQCGDIVPPSEMDSNGLCKLCNAQNQSKPKN